MISVLHRLISRFFGKYIGIGCTASHWRASSRGITGWWWYWIAIRQRYWTWWRWWTQFRHCWPTPNAKSKW